MKRHFSFLLASALIVSQPAEASWLHSIFNQLGRVYGINLDMYKSDQAQLGQLNNLNTLSQNQLGQLNKLNSFNEAQLTDLNSIKGSNEQEVTKLASIFDAMTGTHTYGTDNYNPGQFNWGNDANSWQNILALVQAQGSGQPLGSAIKELAEEYPIDDELPGTNDLENKYYLMQAQTTLASRASANLSFQQMNKEAETLDGLQKEIDQAKDNKSSVDLNNRLGAENARINIEQTKLLAILVQQNAMEAQQKANMATQTARFLNRK